MTFQEEHLLASLAAFYCFALALISLLQKKKSKSHFLFAGYNFANGLWNCGDLILLFEHPGNWEWLHRFTGVGGIWIIPFVVHFSFELLGLTKEYRYRNIMRTFYALGIVFTALTLTRYLNVGALENAPVELSSWRNPGPLYPLFVAYMLSGTISIQIPCIARFRKSVGVLRKRMLYLLIATTLGVAGMGLFFVSFVAVNLPWIYFSLQILVGFIFAYAIFQQDLLGVNVVFRRITLLIGVYSFIGTVLAAIVFSLQGLSPTGSPMPIGTLSIIILLTLSIASLGPWVYVNIIDRFTLFQERSAIELTHEFKTPLSAIQSAQEILDRELAQTNPDPVKIQAYMSMIQRNTQRLEKFVLDILNVGKAGDGAREIHKQKIDLGTLLRDIASHFPNGGEQIHFSNNFTEKHLILADPETLQQVFTNLIANAVASSGEKSIDVSIEKMPAEIQVIIRDQGRGIPREDLERIFQPFARSKHTSNSKSTGLGLAIAERWVRAHNGRIWAESEGVGKGAAFFVVLPH